MKIEDFYNELESFLRSNGEKPFKRLFDLHEALNPSCSLTDVHNLFNDLGQYGNYKLRRRILAGAYVDLYVNIALIKLLHEILLPEIPYQSPAIKPKTGTLKRIFLSMIR